MSLSRLLIVILVAAAALLRPTTGAAQLPRVRVALDLNSDQAMRSQPAAAESVKRRVATTLVPAIEAAGYEVVRVKDYRDARRSGRYEAIIRVSVEARDVFLASTGQVYDKAQAPKPLPKEAQGKRMQVEVEVNQSVEAWATWMVWDGEIDKKTGEGHLAHRMAMIEGQGDSANLDDEENIARVLSDELSQALLPAVDIALTPRERAP